MKLTNTAPRYYQIYISLLLHRDYLENKTERYALNDKRFVLEIIRFLLAFNIMDVLIHDVTNSNFFVTMLWFALLFIPVYAMLLLPIWALFILRKSVWKKMEKPNNGINQNADHVHAPCLTFLSQWKCKICHKDIRPMNRFYEYVPFLVNSILFYPSLYFLKVSPFNFIITFCFYVLFYFVICFGFSWLLQKLFFSKSLFQLEESKKREEN